MPDFDPNQFLADTEAPAAAPRSGESFDPDQFLAATAEPAPEPAENPHEVIPFLKNTAKGIWEGAKGAAGGVVNAAMHPLDTLGDFGEWALLNGGPGGGHDTLVGERSLRSVPVVGSTYDNIRGLADPDYLANKAKEDAAHAAEHPTLDKAQRLLGGSAGMLAGGAPGAGLFVVDAYHRSRLAGNDVSTAMQDARNVGLLIGGGAALSKGLEAGGNAVAESGVGDSMKAAAEKKAFKAAVGNQSKPYDEAAARGVINERGRELLDSGVVGFGDSAQQIADKAGVERAATGKQISSLLGGLDEAAPEGAVSGHKMAADLRDYAAEIGGSGNKALVAKLHEAADDLEKEGLMTFDRAQTHKDSWAWEPGSSVTKVAAKRVKSIIGKEMEDAVSRLDEAGAPGQAMQQVAEEPQVMAGQQTATGETVGAPAPAGDAISAAVDQAGSDLSSVERETLADSMRTELGSAEPVAEPEASVPADPKKREIYERLKSKYGTLAGAVKDAQVTANRYAKNNSASLGDKAAAAAGAVLNPHGTVAKVATGFATGALNKLVRKRGNAAAAVGLDNLGDLLNGNPEAFGGFAPQLLKAAAEGPQKLGVTHYLLMQQDPEYQKLISGKGEKP